MAVSRRASSAPSVATAVDGIDAKRSWNASSARVIVPNMKIIFK
jgi:hypothetical protein